jgi:hypothetical protein
LRLLRRVGPLRFLCKLDELPFQDLLFIQAQIREAFYELAHELVQELPVLNAWLGDIHLACHLELVHLAADVDHAAVHPCAYEGLVVGVVA